MNFVNKVILITGAGNGIGAQIALRFAELNGTLALVDKDEDSLKQVAKNCEEKKNIKPFSIKADLADENELNGIIPKVIDKYGKLHILINNAGIVFFGTILEDDFARNFDKIMAVNVKAPMVLTNKAVPYLIKTQGNIVNICSIRSRTPKENMLLYSTTKAALENFTKGVALELLYKGVRVNAVRPGLVKTNLVSDETARKKLEKAAEQLPYGAIEPSEVANVVTFLASDDARSISGSSFKIDGGRSLMDRF